MTHSARILYCHCANAQVVPNEVKTRVLRRLCDAGVEFEAVADLCELAARRDPELKRLAGGSAIKIAACYPRAVKWLFAASGAPLPEQGTQVLNMRVDAAEAVGDAVLSSVLSPNLPGGKTMPGDAPPPLAATGSSSSSSSVETKPQEAST